MKKRKHQKEEFKEFRSNEKSPYKTIKTTLKSILCNKEIIQSVLNELVFEYCVPRVHGEAEGYIQYKRDVSNMHIPIAHPNFSDYKHKTLELKPWF